MEKLVRKIILYVAIRLDGYIVRGDVALHGQGVNSDNQNRYSNYGMEYLSSNCNRIVT